MTKQSITIATRESPLALWQANWVKGRLQALYPGLEVNLLGITTSADRMSIPLMEVGGKGLFVKELEEALLEKRADIAVHSMKDVPMTLPAGLCLPVMCEREDPWDVLVSNQFISLNELPSNTVVGTSSLRRRSQLCALRPDLQMKDLRGNVNTRLQRLDAGEYGALILAAAGLKRLGLQQRISAFLNADQLLPAPGQGVLGIECREEDIETLTLIAVLNDEPAHVCVTAERALCRRLEGGCQTPIAAYAEMIQEKIFLRGLVANVDGTVILRAQKTGHVEDAEILGETVAEELLSQGARAILSSSDG